jgi:hypothetical protein
MCGKPEEIIKSVVSTMPSGPKKTLISDVRNHLLDNLLDSQLVISDELGKDCSRWSKAQAWD